MQFEQTHHRRAKIHIPLGTVHQHANGDHVAAVLPDNINRLLHTPAFGDDILDDEQFLARRNFEIAAQFQFTGRVFFCKDMAQPERAPDFVTDEQPTHCR